jgi:hypothetical protein
MARAVRENGAIATYRIDPIVRRGIFRENGPPTHLASIGFVAAKNRTEEESTMSQEITPMDKSISLQEHDDADLQRERDPNLPAALADGLEVCPAPVGQMPERKPFKRKPITTLTLTSRTCKWPFGDPAQSGFHYCGRLPQVGRPYCDEHDRMSYQPTRRKTS